MKNAILKFLISRGGAIATPIAAAIVAAVAVKIDPFSHELAEQIKGPEVVGWLTAFILAVIAAWANGKQREGVKDIQQSLVQAGKTDVQIDGVAGPVTKASQREILGQKPEKKEPLVSRLWPWRIKK